MTPRLAVVDDPARVCAAMLLSGAAGGGEIVLTGGSTPKTAYGEFVQLVKMVGMDLSPTTFWIGDERCVGPDDERSNFGMIKASLLDQLPGSSSPVVHRIKGELGPELAAEQYDRELRDAGPPKFDLVLLGIGPDGHIASLFPGQESLSERSRLAIGVPEAGFEPFVARVSLTLAALTSGRQILVLASGESKADAVMKAFGPGARPDPQVPASLLAPDSRDLTVLLDPPAASRLNLERTS